MLPVCWLCLSCTKNMAQPAASKADSITGSIANINFKPRVEGQTAQLADINTGTIRQYLAYVPQGYNAAPSKDWPVIIFLHGSGETGTDLTIVKRNGLPKHLDTARTFPFLVISPQLNNGGYWNTNDLQSFLTEIQIKYNVDPKRIYLTGLSLGGIETWTWAITDPSEFAAIAPVSATGDPTKVAVLKHTPIWVFHGDQDPTVPYSGDVAMVNALKAAGGNVQLFTVAGGKHNIWNQVYTDKDLYAWMLKYKLP